MRLIDADDFKTQIAGAAVLNSYPANQANALCRLIDSQPTAYDVDKVVEQIEARYLKCICLNDESCDYPEKIGCCYDRAVRDCVEVVRSELEVGNEDC